MLIAKKRRVIAYIGKLEDGSVAVYQALPWDMRCWLSGKGKNGNANRIGYVGFEICEDGLKNEAYFTAAVMEAAVLLTAHLCALFGITPYSVVENYSQGDALAVMDHRELHGVQLASNHGDIRNWLSNFGKTMDDFRDAVTEAMQEGVEVTYIDCDDPESQEEPEETVQFIAKAVNPGSYLNIRVNKSKKSNSIGIIMRGDTAEVLNASDPDWWKVRYDGVVGYCMTHSGNDRYLEAVIDTPGEEEKSYTVHITELDYESALKLLEAHPGQSTMEEG